MRRWPLPFLGFFLALIGWQSATAWDSIGHMLVMSVTRPLLKPGVEEKVRSVASQLQFPGSSYDFLTMACWMDDLRTNDEQVPFHGRFKPWHYIDLGLSSGEPMPSFEVTDPAQESEGNIVQALTRAMAVLKGGTDPLIPNQSVALALIVHLTGDIHQPLHCSTYYFSGPNAFGRAETDKGGNAVTVTDSAEEPGRMGGRRLNLHAFWDEAYRAHFEGGEVQLSSMPFYGVHQDSDIDADRFDVAPFVPGPEVSLQTDFKAWALESNQVARDDIYGALHFDSSHRQVVLSDDDVKRANELAKRRIVLAGYRLAQLLNDLWATPAR
jgi:nuclease S1